MYYVMYYSYSVSTKVRNYVGFGGVMFTLPIRGQRIYQNHTERTTQWNGVVEKKYIIRTLAKYCPCTE